MVNPSAGGPVERERHPERRAPGPHHSEANSRHHDPCCEHGDMRRAQTLVQPLARSSIVPGFHPLGAQRSAAGYPQPERDPTRRLGLRITCGKRGQLSFGPRRSRSACIRAR